MRVQIKIITTRVVTLSMYHFSFSFVHKDSSSPSRLLGLHQSQTLNREGNNRVKLQGGEILAAGYRGNH